MYANKMRTALLEPPSHWLPISMYDMQRINYRAWSSAPINILNLDFGLKSVRSAYHKFKRATAEQTRCQRSSPSWSQLSRREGSVNGQKWGRGPLPLGFPSSCVRPWGERLESQMAVIEPEGVARSVGRSRTEERTKARVVGREGGEEWGRGRSAVAKRGRGKVKRGEDSVGSRRGQCY